MDSLILTLGALTVEGSLFLLACTLLSHYCWQRWREQREPLFACLSLLALAGGAAGYLAALTFPLAWAFLLLLLLLFALAVRHFRLSLRSPRFTAAAILVLLAAPSLTLAVSLSTASHQLQPLAQLASKQAAALTSLATANTTAASQLAKESEVLDKVKAQQYGPLASLLQEKLANHPTSFAMLVDRSGTILLWTGQPTSLGANLFAELPWSLPLSQGKQLSGVAAGLDGLPLAIGSAPCGEGALLVGTYLDSDTLRNLLQPGLEGVGLYGRSAGQPEESAGYASSGISQTLLRSPQLTSLAVSLTPSQPAAFQSLGRRHAIATASLPAFLPDPPFTVAVLAPLP